MIEAMLSDLDQGALSVLERGYLLGVEQAHGLPTGERQARSDGLGTYQDVRYCEFGVVVELDGREHHHAPAARDRDALRDLVESANHERLTVRLTYGLVFDRPCHTAALVAQVLRSRGWEGQLQRCPDCPEKSVR